jgi:predicted nucleic acid-binding protein
VADATDRLRVYVDADVLLASCASPSSHSAGQVVLSLSESTLLDAVTSELALEECRRSLERKLPDATETFEFLVRRSLDVVPAPSKETVRRHAGRADWKDVPHLACALKHGCACLVTYNTSDYTPGHPDVQIVWPGELVRRVRERLTGL